MDLDPWRPDTASISHSPPAVALLMEDLAQAVTVLLRELHLLAELMRKPDQRITSLARQEDLLSELCVLDALLIDATRHARRCCALYEAC